MPPIKHALLGASSSHRWLNCTPSAAWERKIGRDVTSEAAMEGTLAHEIAERHLRSLIAGDKPRTPKELMADPMYKPVMEEYIDVYIGYIMEHYFDALLTTQDAILKLEQRVDFSKWVPDGFGTADCLIIADGELQVFDLKYGKGVPVDAVGNPQLRLYALGALDAYEGLYDIERVRVHIIQPRLDSITEDNLTVEELHAWGDDYVKPRAELAAKGEGKHTPGEHCRFCKCQTVCRAYAEAQLRMEGLRFHDGEEVMPPQLTNEQVSEILTRVDGLTRWAKSVKDWALEQAINFGAEFPGYKVVAGRSVRKITNENAALERLTDIGIPASDITRLIGLTDLEEVVGKAKLAEVLGDLVVKPEGKPTLVSDTDKRPALTPRADAMFDSID